MKKDFVKYTIFILLLNFIGIFSIYLTKNTVSDYYFYFYRQLVYFVIGCICFVIFSNINYNFLKKYSFLLYIVGNFLLIYTLFFGDYINGSRCWIKIFGLSIQPSEFVKIFLLICMDKFIKTKFGILKSILLVLIPSILTFLQPDTGTVLFYLVILFSILISLKISKKVYISLFSLVLVFGISYFYLYFCYSELFINIFGTSFFYRTDRILSFLNNDGFQITNALIGIGNGGMFGNYSKYVIYIPEILTDFMFANILIRFGFIGGIVLIVCFLIIDCLIIKDIRVCRSYFMIGLFGVFLYQQIQHICMNIGLLPITGITLPFVSYGGSSLISNFIMFGILFNIKKYNNCI